ncbi:MAG: peptidoglycan-binding protein [Oscillospiraceae bacterium]|nr:peptidoglycan-binding protein [Oscillospiraceae bacterium]
MASTYQLLSYGSRGDAVRRLQTTLNGKGYNLEVDGVYGNLTRAAVMDYQKKNGLQLDGVVGDETWGHLLSSADTAQQFTTSRQVLSGVSDETADRLAALEKGMQPSEEARAAHARYDSVAAMEPQPYQSSFAAQLAQMYQEIIDRPAFSYDPETDSTYQHAARLAVRQGKAAMEDTMGRAAALTGGYGSTYAESAAQQSYGRYLEELAEQIPTLEQSARARYEAEGKAALQRYELLRDQDTSAYSRWKDSYNVWKEARNAARQEAEDADSRDLTIYRKLLDYYADKADAEQKASLSNATATTVKTSGVSKKTSSAKASGTAEAEAFTSAVDKYIKENNTEAARALIRENGSRLTDEQREKLFKMLLHYYGSNR